MAFDPFTAIADVVGKVIDRVIPDKVAAQKAKDAGVAADDGVTASVEIEGVPSA